jgi:hypothetical protein
LCSTRSATWSMPIPASRLGFRPHSHHYVIADANLLFDSSYAAQRSDKCGDLSIPAPPCADDHNSTLYFGRFDSEKPPSSGVSTTTRTSPFGSTHW